MPAIASTGRANRPLRTRSAIAGSSASRRAGKWPRYTPIGLSLLRPAYQKLMADARADRFDVVIAEALDRLSREQVTTAALFQQLTFLGIMLFTRAEGEVNELHVGLKGTMNALFL